MSKAAARKVAPEVEIELEDGLPAVKQDDVAFIVAKMRTVKKAISVPNFLRLIGKNPRPHGQPSTVYCRLLEGFKEASQKGLLAHVGQKYRIPVPGLDD